jgi:hypothetical protein
MSPVNDDQTIALTRVTADAFWRIVALRIVIALADIYVLWRTSLLAIQQASADWSTWLQARLRNLAAGILLTCSMPLQNRCVGAPQLWVYATKTGGLMLFVAASWLAIRLQQLTAGFAAVAFLAVPLMVGVVIAVRGWRISRPDWTATNVGVPGRQDHKGVVRIGAMTVLIATPRRARRLSIATHPEKNQTQ